MRGLGGVSAVKVRPREEERIAIEAWHPPEEGGEVLLGPRLEPAREPAHGRPPEVGAAGLVPWQSPGEVLGLGLRSPSQRGRSPR